MDWILIVAAVAAVLVVAVVVRGLLKSRRVEREKQRAVVELQHKLGERLGPPQGRSVRLPHADAEATYDAVDDLRRQSGP